MRTSIYVDEANIHMNGGYGMNYKVLKDLVVKGDCQLVHAISYIIEDSQRRQQDSEYDQKQRRFYWQLRQAGFSVKCKTMRRYEQEDGQIVTKGDMDVEIAVDCLLHAKTSDRIILLTGNGDFHRLVLALQDMGKRVEIIGFGNVSRSLQESADFYICGFAIKDLIPPPDREFLMGFPVLYVPGGGYGFFKYYEITDFGPEEKTIYFHVDESFNELPEETNEIGRESCIYQFQIGSLEDGRTIARNVKLVRRSVRT